MSAAGAAAGAKAFGKILRGVGAKVGKAAAGAKAHKGVGVARTIFDKVDVDDKTASAFSRLAGFKMNSKAAKAIGGATAVVGVANEGRKSRNISKLGEIQASELSNMVNITRSPDLEGTMKAIESDPELMAKYQKKYLPIDSRGAEGDIVFALHNLRNPN